MLALSFPDITRTDVWAVAIVALLVTFLVKSRGHWPDVTKVQALATVSNTKGGMVVILLGMWLFTLMITVLFCVWIIVKGVDPQHPVVTTLLGMLVAQAFGTVNGALFTAFKGEDPKPTPGTSVVVTHSDSATAEHVEPAATVPPAV